MEPAALLRLSAAGAEVVLASVDPPPVQLAHPALPGDQDDHGALAERMHEERDRDQLVTEHRMADSFLAAFDEWRAEDPPSEQR